MTAQDVIRILSIVGKVYERILDGSQNIVIPSAIAGVKASKAEYDRTKRNQSRGVEIKPWGYAIDDENPLRFVPSKIKDLDLQADVYCDIQWEDNAIPVKQEIKVRIWSSHDKLIFDENRDSEAIFKKLADPARRWQGRVVSRFHFDRANEEQKGPKFHLQLGGNPRDYELCWHPSSVNVPRFQFHPMELFLTCQMIAANFFWDEYLEIQQKSEWRAAMRLCQRELLISHYQDCLAILQGEESLLDNLWIN